MVRQCKLILFLSVFWLVSALPAAGDPAVAFKTIDDKPEWGICGGGAFGGAFVGWKVKWFLTTASGKDVQPTSQDTESWVVQHYVLKFDIHWCDPPHKKTDDKDEDSYELWRMGKNAQAITKYEYDFKGDGTKSKVDYNDSPSFDDFISSTKEHNLTYGSWTLYLDASYQSKIADGEFSMEPTSSSRQLPVRRGKDGKPPTPPTFLGKATLTRQVDAHWNCCQHDFTTTGTATAKNYWKTYEESWEKRADTDSHKKRVDGKKVP